MIERVTTLWNDRTVRLGSIAAVPPLWFAIAWADLRLVLVAVVCGTAATMVLRILERRRPDDDEPLWL